MVVPSPAAHYAPMHLISGARTQAGITGFSIALALLALAPGASTSFAAEQPPSVSHLVLDRTGVATTPGNAIIMRDGGICDPIRHMGC